MSRRSAPPPSSSSSHLQSPSYEEIYSPIPRHLSIIPSLTNLSITNRNDSSSSTSSITRYPQDVEGSSSRGSIDMNYSPIFNNIPGRVYTATPSSTSISSDDEDDNDISRNSMRLGEIQQAKSWLDMDSTHDEIGGNTAKNKGKGKGKDKEVDRPDGLAGRLPPEILIQILRFLPENKDLISALLVSKSWCLCTFSLIWTKPQISSIKTLISIIRIISKPNKTTTLPYSTTIKRIHLSTISDFLTDELFIEFKNCSKLERLTLTNCLNLSTDVLVYVIKNLKELIAIDLSGIENENINDHFLIELSKNCNNLQAINLSDCKYIGDEGVLALAKGCKLLKRVKFSGCHRLTAKSLIPLIQNCPLLLELDLTDVISINNYVVCSIFTNLNYLRDVKLNNCTQLTEDCIPNLINLKHYSNDQLFKEYKKLNTITNDVKSYFIEIENDLGYKCLKPKLDYLDNLRSIDLTGCSNIGDIAIINLISNSPKLRTLTLTKCANLTDRSLESIEKLGKHLHYLHLGHDKLITDAGVNRLAKSCTRLRYIDLACCDLLSDESIIELGINMPKLKRVGLVKVTKITDDSIYSLVEKYTALERIHLSYCDNLSVKVISHMLNRLPHLKHLSLTGVSCFKKKELQHFCRPPPDNFNEHQRSAFCVFSGNKVDELRRYLNEVYLFSLSGIESDSTSTRRNSGSSSTSSITVPGTSSPPSFILPNQPQYNSNWITSSSTQFSTTNQGNYNSNSNHGYIYRRGSAPTLRNNGGVELNPVPGLPSIAFINPTPNFLAPTETIPSRRNDRSSNLPRPISRYDHGLGAAFGIPSRIRESNLNIIGGSPMSSREGSQSSVDDRERDRRYRVRASHTHSHTNARDRPLGPRQVSSSSQHQHQYRPFQNDPDVVRVNIEDNRQYNMPGGLWEERSFSTSSSSSNNGIRRRNEIQNPNPNPNSNISPSELGRRWFG